MKIKEINNSKCSYFLVSSPHQLLRLPFRLLCL